jgi:Acetyltransferase (GNAT) domain
MSGSFNIQYLSNQEIDKTKWDNCINKAPNGLVYAWSFYLDIMAKHWDALVLNDYEAVMPLTWNKKYGIRYLYPPFLTAMLGLFGQNISAELLEAFLKAIPSKFKYWDISLNHHNIFNLKNFELYQRSNYVLDLNKPYAALYKSYKENIQRNIRKAEQAGCTTQKDFEVNKVIELAVQQMKKYSKESAENVERFKKLYQVLHQQQKAITYGIISAEKKLLASSVFFFSHNRAYYILVGNHPDGKNIGASHALINAFIKDHAGKNMLLDFEGSDIPGLALFYSSFGSVEEKYAAIKLNRLPFYLKFFKK